MTENQSIEFFDKQFRSQPKAVALRLNPFEELALPYLTGEMLDFGCGMGNLSFEAAKRGCRVLALDGSQAAVEHIRVRATEDDAAVSAYVADLKDYALTGEYDCVVSIGLLMFFDCATAFKVLTDLQARVRPGGVLIINVLVEGTTYLDMFDASGHCIFNPQEIEQRFAGWTLEHLEINEFEAPHQTLKRFSTVIARKPIAVPKVMHNSPLPTDASRQ
jgi:tellurite methyltransferase